MEHDMQMKVKTPDEFDRSMAQNAIRAGLIELYGDRVRVEFEDQVAPAVARKVSE